MRCPKAGELSVRGLKDARRAAAGPHRALVAIGSGHLWESQTKVASIWEQVRKDVGSRSTWREAGRLCCHLFVIKKRWRGWDLGENDLFPLRRF